MKKVSCFALVLALASTMIACIHVRLWSIGNNSRTGEPQISCFLEKTKLGGFNIHTLGFTQIVWMYSLTLKGAPDTYGPKEISVSNLSLQDFRSGQSSHLAIDSGSVRLDRSKNKIIIALKVTVDGKIGDFVGNGEYEIPRNSK